MCVWGCARGVTLFCVHVFLLTLASCTVVPVPTAVGEVTGCQWVTHTNTHTHLYVCALQTCAACSSTTLPGLFCFLVAGAAVRSLPSGSRLFVYPWAPAIFLCGGKRKRYGNRMSIPGRRGQRNGRTGWRMGGVMTLQIWERTTDTIYGSPSWSLFLAMLRIENIVVLFFGVFFYITSMYYTIILCLLALDISHYIHKKNEKLQILKENSV